jgi:hypothetical protein
MVTALISTRDTQVTETKSNLLAQLCRSNIDVKLGVGQHSIFDFYNDAVKSMADLPSDHIVIMCHDDIEILNDREDFKDILDKGLKPSVGFVGVAGTTLLGTDAVWWEINRRRAGLHRGMVYQGKRLTDPFVQCNMFGVTNNEVVVLDGCFMAARLGTLRDINLARPDEFQGNWDFYDLFYTMQTFLQGKKNMVIPVVILHNSPGSLVGRDSWVKNREAFQKMFELPKSV